MTTKRENPIPEKKIKAVKELKELLTGKNTVLIASISNLPASQLQEISKKLRGKALVKIPKKNLLFRAIDETKKEELKQLKEKFKGAVAILFSDQESFDLAADILKNKTPAKAKPGQEAPEDIVIEAGPTDLPPGPAISELSSVGLQVAIENGKITIKQSKTIVKKGEKIPQNAAEIMSKLDIKPFSIGLIPLSSFDNTSGKFYAEISINTEEAVNELKEAFGRALPFAVEIGYVNSDTIKFLLGKAGAHEKALAALIKTEAPAEEPKAETEAPAAETPSAPAESPSPEQTQTPENKTEENKSQEENK